jgi:hypothetical protein
MLLYLYKQLVLHTKELRAEYFGFPGKICVNPCQTSLLIPLLLVPPLNQTQNGRQSRLFFQASCVHTRRSGVALWSLPPGRLRRLSPWSVPRPLGSSCRCVRSHAVRQIPGPLLLGAWSVQDLVRLVAGGPGDPPPLKDTDVDFASPGGIAASLEL